MAMTDRRAVEEAPPDAFEDFYRREWPRAVRLASLLTQTIGAEDVAQEAFTRVYPKWHQIENPQAYLRTAIVNGCRSAADRANTAKTKLPLVAVDESVDFAFDSLADAVASLPYRPRAVLVLRYYEGCSEAEIASALNCRPGTVKSLASRARAAQEGDRTMTHDVDEMETQLGALFRARRVRSTSPTANGPTCRSHQWCRCRNGGRAARSAAS